MRQPLDEAIAHNRSRCPTGRLRKRPREPRRAGRKRLLPQSQEGSAAPRHGQRAGAYPSHGPTVSGRWAGRRDRVRGPAARVDGCGTACAVQGGERAQRRSRTAAPSRSPVGRSARGPDALRAELPAIRCATGGRGIGAVADRRHASALIARGADKTSASRQGLAQPQVHAGLQRAGGGCEHQIVIAAKVMTVAPDFGHLEPMLDAAQRELHVAGVTQVPRCCLPMPAIGLEGAARLRVIRLPAALPRFAPSATGPPDR